MHGYARITTHSACHTPHAAAPHHWSGEGATGRSGECSAAAQTLRCQPNEDPMAYLNFSILCFISWGLCTSSAECGPTGTPWGMILGQQRQGELPRWALEVPSVTEKEESSVQPPQHTTPHPNLTPTTVLCAHLCHNDRATLVWPRGPRIPPTGRDDRGPGSWGT